MIKNFTKIKVQKWLEKNTPRSIKKVARSTGASHLFRSLFLNKYESEMAMKLEWGAALSRPEVFERASEYWFKYRFLQEIIDMTGLNSQSVVLDVGCGIATVLHFVPGKEKIGVDPIADWYLQHYAYPAPIQIMTSGGESLNLPEVYFDVTFCSNALDHVTDHTQVLSEISRVTKAEGYFVLTVEIHPVEKDYVRDVHHPHTFSKKAVYEMLQNSGWEILFEKETPFLGVKQYALRRETKNDTELVIVARKKQSPGRH